MIPKDAPTVNNRFIRFSSADGQSESADSIVSASQLARCNQYSAVLHSIRMIDTEDIDGDSSDCRRANQRRAIPTKMLGPNVIAWMKETRHSVQLDSGDVRSLRSVAFATAKREVFEDGRSVVFDRDDMVDLKGQNIQ
jgi:hypothetical protein